MNDGTDQPGAGAAAPGPAGAIADGAGFVMPFAWRANHAAPPAFRTDNPTIPGRGSGRDLTHVAPLRRVAVRFPL